jgi:small subunit ribosomal protein S11
VAEKKMVKKPEERKKKKTKGAARIVAHIQSSNNNTLVTVSDEAGNVICQSSAGALGYKGSKKSTPFAAGQAALKAAQVAKDAGAQFVKVEVKGPGQGRETAVRSFAEAGITVTEIRDVSPIPHNGCRPPKRRRI